LKKAISGHRFSAAIEVLQGDFFDLYPLRSPHRSGLVVLNPPYGRRIETPEGPRTLLERIGSKLLRDFAGWKFALMAPAKSMLQQLPLPATLVPVFHGGLQVFAAIGRVPPLPGQRQP
jgi:putative N6-adenine-specific DNA methylase